MILINFSHPLTAQQLQSIADLSGKQVQTVLDVPVQFDSKSPYIRQVRGLLNDLPLTSREWQTEAILVNPPALNYIAVLLLAELHGRMGYFTPVVRLRQFSDNLPPTFEVAEILNLQDVREQARKVRNGEEGA